MHIAYSVAAVTDVSILTVRDLHICSQISWPLLPPPVSPGHRQQRGRWGPGGEGVLWGLLNLHVLPEGKNKKLVKLGREKKCLFLCLYLVKMALNRSQNVLKRG